MGGRAEVGTVVCVAEGSKGLWSRSLSRLRKLPVWALGSSQGRREEELELFKNPQSASELPALVRVGRQGSRAPPAEKGHPPPLRRALGDRGEGRGRAQLEVEPSVRLSLLNSSFYQA